MLVALVVQPRHIACALAAEIAQQVFLRGQVRALVIRADIREPVTPAVDQQHPPMMPQDGGV